MKRCAALRSGSKFGEQQEAELERIDVSMTLSMLWAERRLRPARTGDPFSVRLNREKRLRRYWRILLKKRHRLLDSGALLRLN